jgi:hypothetical protein
MSKDGVGASERCHWQGPESDRRMFDTELVPRVCDMIDALIDGCPWTKRKTTKDLLNYCKEECEEAKAELVLLAQPDASSDSIGATTRRLESELGDGASASHYTQQMHRPVCILIANTVFQS